MNFSYIRTGIILIIGIFLGFFLEEKLFSFSQKSNTVTILTKQDDIFSSQKIEQTKSIIQNKYYHFNEKTKEEIEEGMIKGIITSLGDKHSNYFPPKEAKEFNEMLGGDFEGIGAVIDDHPKGIFIRKIFDTSPAKKAGLEDGDIIIKVGNESMVGVKVEDAVKKIRGPKGSKIELHYLRFDEENTVEVTRDTITVPSVQGKILSGSTIGYVEVAFFGAQTTNEFQKTLSKLYTLGAKSLILDFRDNGGGYLDVAVEILSYFLPEGSHAVTTRENDLKKTITLLTKKNIYTNTTLPIVMLINPLSASATEIVAGALQDYKRALIIGEKSYGKGSVQEPFLLNDGSIIKITIGRWYTPKDQNIDKDGIKPDIFVPLFQKDYSSKYDRQLEAAKEAITEMNQEGNNVEKSKEKLLKKDFTQ